MEKNARNGPKRRKNNGRINPSGNSRGERGKGGAAAVANLRTRHFRHVPVPRCAPARGESAVLREGAAPVCDVTSAARRRTVRDVTASAGSRRRVRGASAADLHMQMSPGAANEAMSRRRVWFQDPPGEGEGPEEPKTKRRRPEGGPGSRFPALPPPDSDEEEEEEEEEELRAGGPPVEGQEPGPAPGVGEGPVPLTPFNLEEEMGEGRFDPHGHFLPLPRRETPDPWLETLEGMPIKPRPLPPPGRASPPPSPPPLPQLLRGALALLRPRETVGGALRRWGGGGGAEGEGRGEGQGARPSPPELEALVALSDALVARGVLGVLGESRERLRGRLRALGGEGRGEGQEGEEEEGEEEEEEEEEGEGEGQAAPALDMFAPPEEGEGREALPEVLWEYHWGGEGDPPTPLYGPFSSAQMQAWADQGYFRGGGGARCRRLNPPDPPGPFYDCGRVDFQLYT
nr:LOW QUALITY PROTEIN: CD2 antigen cytoplasmic tail-binding protein 2-like [Taeniopygia guttata]